MSNLDKINAERDDFIRKTLQEDKLVSDPVLDTFENYIDNANIKVKKYTYKQKNITLFLLCLLCISIGFNIYLSSNKTANQNLLSSTLKPNNMILSNSENENKISETVVKNNTNSLDKNTSNTLKTNSTIGNTITNTITNTNTSNDTTNNVITNISTEKNPINASENIDISKFKDFLETYSLGINRIKYNEDNLESNTFLLILARKYFSSIPAKSIPDDQKDKFVLNVENTNLYIKELTGKNFTGHYISSYSNYIGYSSSSNSYVYGKDIENVTKEKYICTDLQFTDLENSVYTATARVERHVDETVTLYDLEIKFELNATYTYQPFKILNMVATNKSVSPDNTVHLVD